MTTKDYWFAVGFIAGEGHIGLYNGAGLVISVSQIELTPLLRLQEIFGGVISDLIITNQKPKYIWRANGPTAAGIIMTLATGLKQVHAGRYKQA